MNIATAVRPAALSLVEVVGSDGLLMVHPVTGVVVRCIPFDNSTDYLAITRFDLAEWSEAWGELPCGRQLDILDVGHWRGEQFTPPEAGWRDDVRRARQARAACLRLVIAKEAGQ